ncbi:MAG: PEP-CTERM sorting domain-containing protein [Tepidisphaeraceae bacterium]|jgi:hypothetical protein
MRRSFACRVVYCLCAIPLLGLANLASAGLVTTDPSLPPPTGVYATSTGGQITFSSVYLGSYNPIVLTDINLVPSGISHTDISPDEREQFTATLSGMASAAGGSAFSFTGTGPAVMLVYGKYGHVLGTFDTEMTQLDLSGTTPLGTALIRESPTHASTGQTTIVDMGGGVYNINSFFDVFTELSVDGGNSWIPSQGSTRLTLLPEPASLSLAGFAVLGLLARRRRA